MLTLAVVSQKGGAGKTTLTVHLAVAAMRAGEKVAILDTDPQHSASAWARTREDEEPLVVEVDPGEVPDALATAKQDGYTLIVLDTSPRAEPIAAATCRASDFVLAPCRPSAFDLATVEQTVSIITAAGKASASAIVLNGCPARAPEVAEARSLCEGLAMPLATVELGLRRAFARAVQSGRAVQEFEPSGTAAAEIAALWAYVHEHMKRRS
jgi:chromosome partitioning protein